jgi:hypothetical protein
VTSGGKLTVNAGGVVQDGLTVSAGTASIAGSVGAGQVVDLAGQGGLLALSDLPDFHAVIRNFGPQDKIDLAGFAFKAKESESFSENIFKNGRRTDRLWRA